MYASSNPHNNKTLKMEEQEIYTVLPAAKAGALVGLEASGLPKPTKPGFITYAEKGNEEAFHGIAPLETFKKLQARLAAQNRELYIVYQFEYEPTVKKNAAKTAAKTSKKPTTSKGCVNC